MKRIIFLCIPLLSFIYSADQSSLPCDSLSNIRFEFGVRCQEVAKRCKTNDKDCKFAIAQLRDWLNAQAFDKSEKNLLLSCIEQPNHENS